MWDGCWCTWFHEERAEKGSGAAGRRDLKHRLVEEGKAHAALVFDGDVAVGWCEYGTPEELPNIYHRAQYEKEQDLVPDYRLTCFFIDRDHRRQGVSAAALHGALDLVAQAGGGVVEGYPRDTEGKRMSASFLYNGCCRTSPCECRRCRSTICNRSGLTGSRAASAKHNDNGAGERRGASPHTPGSSVPVLAS
ncbi:hypothetical protein BH24ACT8_BH24ACT8_15470 [soil metagenome]